MAVGTLYVALFALCGLFVLFTAGIATGLVVWGRKEETKRKRKKASEAESPGNT